MKVQLPHVEADSKPESDIEEMEGTSIDSEDNQEDDSYDEEYDVNMYEDDDDVEEEVGGANEINRLLAEDIERLKDKYGEQVVRTCRFDNIDIDTGIDIDINISIKHLDPVVAKAWSLKRDKDLIVRLQMKLTHYLDAKGEPEIKVSQPSIENFAAGSQIRNILELFFRKHWNEFTNEAVQKACDSQVKDVQQSRCEGAVAPPTSLPDIDHTKMEKSKATEIVEKQSTEGHAAKVMPSLSSGFLVMIYEYVRKRLDTLNEFCIMCDEPHALQNATMLKPVVCDRELCIFSCQTMMVGFAVDEDTDIEVMDLLICMARSACKSKRNELIFNPYPTVVDPQNHKALAFSPRCKDFVRCAKALDALDIKMLRSCSSLEFKKNIDEKDPWAIPLLKWLVRSNRSHLVKVPKEKHVEFMRTPHQYFLMSSPPAKEAAFRQHKRKHGSTFAFHGSKFENWHSILRGGLISASETKYQVNGCMYGKGIYLTPNASTALCYSSSRGNGVATGSAYMGRTFVGPPLTGPPLTGPPFTGPQLTGPPYTGPPLTGPPYTGPPHTGPPLTGPPFTGPSHTGPPFTGPQLTGPPFTGPSHTGPPLTGPPHTGTPLTAPPLTLPLLTAPPLTLPLLTALPHTGPPLMGPWLTGPPLTGPSNTGPPLTGPPPMGPPFIGPPHTAPPFTGPPLTGPSHTGQTFTGPLFTGPPHTGPLLTGPWLTGPPLTGPSNTGPLHTGPPFTGPSHTGQTFTGPPFTGPPHTGPPFMGQTLMGPSLKRPASKGSASRGSTSMGSASNRSESKGSASKGSTSKGSASKGSASKGSLSKGSATKGSPSKESASMGSASKGSTSKGPTAVNYALTNQASPPREERVRYLSSHKNLKCVALCEVVNSPELRKEDDIWVMPDPEKVCTRFFFVYTSDRNVDSVDLDIDTQSAKYMSRIKQAMAYQS